MTTTQRVYQLLENETLWEVASRCHELFRRSDVHHSICGGVAVCLHGYQRNTSDIDFVIKPSDADQVKQLLTEAGFLWNELEKKFRSGSGIPVQFLLAGEKAGKGSEVLIPEPTGEFNVEEREGLYVVRLSRLIEMKLASGLGNLRRTHKDFADVVELIAVRKLDGTFAKFLHSSLRDTFRQLVHNAQATD